MAYTNNPPVFGTSVTANTTTDLAAADVTSLAVGTRAYNQALAQFFTLVVSSASLVTDAVVAVAGYTNLRWINDNQNAVPGNGTINGGQVQVAFQSPVFDLFNAGSTGAAITVVPAAAGRTFHVSAFEVVPASITGTITGNPKFSAGSDAGTFTALVNNVQTGNLAANVFINVATTQAIQSLTGPIKAFVSTAATGTGGPAITGYVIVRGWYAS